PGESAPGDARDQDAALGYGRQPETVAPEGHRPRAPGIDPRAALAARRDRIRAAPARLSARDSEKGAPAREEIRAERPGARGSGAGGRSPGVREAEDESAGRAARQARRRRAQGAGAHVRRGPRV